MEFIDYEAESCVFNTVLEIRIEDFLKATEMVAEEHRNPHTLIESIYAAVYPDGLDEDTEGWLVVLPDVDIKTGRIPENNVLSWIVSIIDVKGDLQSPRSFEGHHGDFQHEKYLKRSFILERAGEFLDQDVLTLHCDIYFSWNGNKDVLVEHTHESKKKTKERQQLLNNFLRSIQKVRIENDSYTVYDFTHQILTLPQYHELRRRFGVFGIAPSFSWASSGLKQDSKDIMKHAWVFETHPDKFLLFLDKKRENVGARLLKASPFIKGFVDNPLKENQEKRIDFFYVDSQTFILILFFLEKGTLPPSKFDELVHVYKISHLFGMKELQQKCSEHFVKSLEFPTDFEELKRIADLYSDEYLSTLLDISCEEDVFPLLFGRRLYAENRLNSQCYI